MLASFLYWQFIDSPKKLIFIIKQTLIYIFNTFSIGYLFKTLFAPWKRDISNVVNPSIGDYFMTWVNNLISRLIGFIVRSLTILSGLIIIFIAFIVGVMIFVVWFLSPLLAIYFISKSLVFF